MADKEKNVTSDRRVIYFSGSFNEDAAKNAIERLVELELKDPTKDILMYIDSYGGAADSFIAIHDMIKMVRCRVSTFCLGKAHSAGQLLLSSGAKGLRFISPNSNVLMHMVSNFTCGKVKDLEKEVEATQVMQDRIEKFMTEYTNMSREDVKRYMDGECHFTAEEAVKLGIADEIITSNTDLYKKLNL